ncbi:hypothetical protein OSB04_024401 [Centaurea solstitialis]|uniref:Uncharacterized protein n=1 Tax=Centaurea solstitialis TaxID=347529 RepID=A0AA38SL19_9ASTR|nr:hypothetical protein OSB04_024401 [Centaurea solstitialis]
MVDSDDEFDLMIDQVLLANLQAAELVCKLVTTGVLQNNGKGSSNKRPRGTNKERGREEGHDKLIADYFSNNPVYNDEDFKRQFRMTRRLFLRIVNDLEREIEYFKQHWDARGVKGFSALQKCTSAIRQLAYGSASDASDEYLRMSETTSRDFLENFCKAIFNESTQCMNKSTACPACLVASTVCIGPGKIAPSHGGQFHRGDHAGPTVILEAVASYDEWIWHAFFGVPGATNDIIVVNQSPVFNDLFEDKAPDSSFVANGTHYNHGYYLADGIYLEWTTFVKAFRYPHDDERRIHFKERQELARKDIERTFATLQSKWHMVKRPARVWTRTKLQEIMYTCIILHNMIREDEGISNYSFDPTEVLPEDIETNISEADRARNVNLGSGKADVAADVAAEMDGMGELKLTKLIYEETNIQAHESQPKDADPKRGSLKYQTYIGTRFQIANRIVQNRIWGRLRLHLSNDLKAQSLIRLHLSNDVLQDVAEEETSYQIWTKLDKMFMEKSLLNKLHMKLKLYALRLYEGGSITAHLSKFKEIVGDLKNLEVKYDDEDLGLILLCSLPPSFGTRDSLSLDEVYTALISKEKMKEINPGHEPRAEGLNARGRPFEKCLSSSSKSRSKSRGKPRKFCNFCKRKGHTMEECFKLQAKNKAKNKTTGTSGEADVVEQGEVGFCNGEVLMVSEGMMNTSEEWILDSGCTFHMCPHRSWFHTYEKVPEGVVMMGNNDSCPIIGKGTIRIRMHDGITRTLGDVRYVPELQRNLISLSTLDRNGYEFIGKNGVVRVKRGALLMMKALRKTANLYILQGQTVTGDVAVASKKFSDGDLTKLWHLRLGCMSLGGMIELSQRDLLDGHKVTDLQFCEYCVYGKTKRVRFSSGIHTTKGPLDYIHSDL